jgi:hypothetical protein
LVAPVVVMVTLSLWLIDEHFNYGLYSSMIVRAVRTWLFM